MMPTAMKKRKSAGPVVVGLDCSTTGAKAIAFDSTGQQVALAATNIPLRSPRPGHYEQHATDWWNAARRVLQSVTQQVDPGRIVAIGIANQRETFVPLDVHGAPLRPAILWLDERCKSEVDRFAAKVGRRRIHRITGKPVDYAPVVYRVAWVKRHEPALFRRIAMVADVHAYLAWQLTDLWRTSLASADPLGMVDMKRECWSPVVLRAAGLSASQLPGLVAPGAGIGIVHADAARATGLCEGTLVVAGGGDGQCAGLASNVLSAKRAYLNFGTAFVAGLYGEEYRVSEAFRTMTAIAERGYYYELSLRAGTFSLDWFLGTVLGVSREEMPRVHRKLTDEAAHVAPGCNGLRYVPYICGAMNPYWDAHARGSFTGLASSHGKAHFYRAILEGVAFEQAVALDAAERVVGARVKEIVAMGGGAANTLWVSVMADITGRQILIPSTLEASALGAGIAAAVGAGWFDSFTEAAGAMTGVRQTVLPDAGRHARYRTMLQEYKRIYPSLKRASAHPA
jgi:sugar (pentulose or hexulose) kinase